MSELVIGTAVPRSGTTSLSVLLHEAQGGEVYHEQSILPFDTKRVHFKREVEHIQNTYDGTYVGDVSFMWLPYLHMLRSETEANIVGLVREKSKWLESAVETQRQRRFNEHQFFFPDFDLSAVALEEAWERYYDYAIRRFEMFDVPTFKTSNLSDKDTQKDILDAAGIAEEDRQYYDDLRYNSRPDT